MNSAVKEQDLFAIKTITKQGLTKVDLNCWVQFKSEFNQNDYQRYISGLCKKLKTEVYGQKIRNGDNFEYIIDLNIRDSPSKTAFINLQLSLFTPKKLKHLDTYTQSLKELISNNPEFSVFLNSKKKKKGNDN